uniref:Solute carrier family 25 member 32 n=1 Tax=Aceria tosichella TaxID=561515 RepID=A0A6G1S532_9ACAR
MSYEHLVAGIVGGLTSTVVLHPLDLLKVRFAVSDGQSESKKNYKNIRNAFSTIVREEGFKGLYKGVIPNCLGAGTAWGLYFLFYNSAKKHMLDSSQVDHLGPLRHMAAGACAGALTTTITNPIWVVKTRLCLQYGQLTTTVDPAPTATAATSAIRAATKESSLPASKQYSGTWDALKKVYKYEGVTGLYRGFVPGLLGVSHGAVQLATYEEMKKFYLEKNNLPHDHNLGTLQYLTCAALSKLVAASITYPYQVVRARLQDQHVSYEGVFDVVKKTWRNEGLVGFYKGLGPSLLRVVPASALTFVVYEKSLVFLKGDV